ncbi:MAG: hypothetical protein AB1724_19310 [Thermodesulfobacteriota bacterium]
MAALGTYIRRILDENGPLQFYQVQFSLDKLLPGVDNVRYDVNISLSFRNITTQLVDSLITAEVKALGGRLIGQKALKIDTDWSEFQKFFAEVMLSAVNRAKQSHELQIVSLAQAAITQMCREIIQTQFGNLVQHYRQQIRKHEVSHSHDLNYLFLAKEELGLLQQNRLRISSRVARELMKNILESWERDIHKSYIANFGDSFSVPREFFFNPVLFVNGAINDFFMLREYVLLGHRTGDPLRYDALLAMLKQFLARTLPREQNAAAPPSTGRPDQPSDQTPTIIGEQEISAEMDRELDAILCCVTNIDLLFDYSGTMERWEKKNRGKPSEEDGDRIRKISMAQKQRLIDFYESCRRAGLLDPIMAFYGMQPILSGYCPPLLPHDVLNFFVSKGERKKILEKLKRLKSRSGYNVSIKPLLRAARWYRVVRKSKRLDYLLSFLRGFATFHRDFCNFSLISENLQWVNLLNDDKRINLSRVNRTLYEFLRPEEQAPESRPIRNHVIIKADVRGSTEITSQLTEKKLNPASYFSLNFFDPINEILPDYNATKVFIEGDALILSIVEKENTPEGWYAVARACGLAIRILRIVKQYNEKSRQHQLPVLEQGIGICFLDSPPTFLFDGDNRIMISWAINRADRLSSCHKGLRKYLEKKTDIFNLFVFMSSLAGGAAEDAKYLRYNVNGIELDGFAFKKLSREIDLKQLVLSIPEVSKGKISVYTGIFPTQSGQYQRIIVREAMIPKIHPETFRLEGMSSEKYYEVCTSQLIYDHIKNLV